MPKALRIIVAEPIGFCFGVKRAINLAKRARRSHSRVWTLGALIHNPEVVAELRREGIRKVRSVRDARSGALVIRSHGCRPEILKQARGAGIEVIDATCPYVGRVQRVVSDLKTAGYSVIIVGERNHPEVQSLLGYAQDAGMVYKPHMKLKARKIGVVAQTTIPLKAFQTALADLCQGDFEELRVFNTICAEAASRQAAALKIAQGVDLMVVIGGRNSANTSRLADIAREAGKQTYQVENQQELNPGWFVPAHRVGVTAGTSTPSWVVDDVLAALRGRLTPTGEPGELAHPHPRRATPDARTFGVKRRASLSASGGVSRDRISNRRCTTNALRS
jgi:4-hydroxy-3-methylbut-2-enyl diphosphate reductase